MDIGYWILDIGYRAISDIPYSISVAVLNENFARCSFGQPRNGGAGVFGDEVGGGAGEAGS